MDPTVSCRRDDTDGGLSSAHLAQSAVVKGVRISGRNAATARLRAVPAVTALRDELAGRGHYLLAARGQILVSADTRVLRLNGTAGAAAPMAREQ